MQSHLRRMMTVAILCLVPAAVWACSVPVFRYALEHWQPDPYRVYLYHDADLNDADRNLLAWIEAQQRAGANVVAETVDLRESLDPVVQQRWDQLVEKTTPRMAVHLPGRAIARIGAGDPPVETTPWSEDEVHRLMASPLRTELGKRLTDGHVVWVFLESGDAGVDQPLFDRLTEQLAMNQRTLKLPAIEEADLAEISTDPAKLKIRFSSLRLRRDDPAEKWLVASLLSVESDLRDEGIVDQPMVFPVFGRGRALYALVGQGIAEDTIRQAATFLTGACQCTVKADNPGVDLLIPRQWDHFIEKTAAEAVELPLVGLGGGLPLAANSNTGLPIAATGAGGADTARGGSPGVSGSPIENGVPGRPTTAASEAVSSQNDAAKSATPAMPVTGLSEPVDRGGASTILLLSVAVVLGLGIALGVWGMTVLRN